MTDLLRVRDLHVEFRVAEGIIRAVRGISFRVRPGSTVALVGESGSGKSVVAQAIMGILPRPARITRGEILFTDPEFPKAIDIAKLDPDGGRMRSIRGGNISIIFQEPMTSLSPLHTVGNQVGEAVMLHRDVDSAQARELTVEMLRLVGFPDPKRAVDTYPFELSGGLRQRAMIAMALICHPSLLIADEPTTALDVTIQAQILKLLADLQAELGMAVRDDQQGKGVGSALMQAVLDLADNWLNLIRIELHVYTDNTAGVALYEKFGFQIEGTHYLYAFRNGEYTDAYSMARITKRDS